MWNSGIWHIFKNFCLGYYDISISLWVSFQYRQIFGTFVTVFMDPVF